MRANLVLNKDTIGRFDKFTSTVDKLIRMGADYISAWPIRGIDDKPSLELGPDNDELRKMQLWIDENNYGKKIRLLTEETRELYRTGKKLTLFPDGTLSSTWCA